MDDLISRQAAIDTIKALWNDACEFLGYLVEEYELNNFVRKEE